MSSRAEELIPRWLFLPWTHNHRKQRIRYEACRHKNVIETDVSFASLQTEDAQAPASEKLGIGSGEVTKFLMWADHPPKCGRVLEVLKAGFAWQYPMKILPMGARMKENGDMPTVLHWWWYRTKR